MHRVDEGHGGLEDVVLVELCDFHGEAVVCQGFRHCRGCAHRGDLHAGGLSIGAQATDLHVEVVAAQRKAGGLQVVHADRAGRVGADELFPLHAACFLAHAHRQALAEAGAERILREGAGALAALLDAGVHRLAVRLRGGTATAG